MVYTGIIVLQPKERHSYTGREPRNAEEYYEMTFAETDRVIQRARGVPIHVEHLGAPTRVGHVIQAGYDELRRVLVRFELDASREADAARNLIEKGYLRGLSLSHVRETSEPIEISLCFKGARPGTGIVSASATGCESTTPACKVNPLTHQMQTSAVVVQASASMEPATFTPKPPAAAAAANSASTGSADISNSTKDTLLTADAEAEVFRQVLDAAGISDDKKQRVLEKTLHNYKIIDSLGSHAATLEKALAAANKELDQQRRQSGESAAQQLQVLLKFIQMFEGDASVSDELKSRVKNVAQEPNAVNNVLHSMLPTLVQASYTASRFREEATTRKAPSQAEIAYNQLMARWQPQRSTATSGVQPSPLPPLPPLQQQHVVEASHTAAAAPLVPPEIAEAVRLRDEMFRREQPLALTAPIAKRHATAAAAADDDDDVHPAKRFGGLLPTLKYQLQ